ncbi:MAG: hypothetical protein KGL48_06185 [Sphingomonadales bacterium]|nr:hypothetical protein [Sphingomonadales bacterium]MDE2568967.1 hypothetical protein [Sphingomonadales bacterium]
MVQKEFDPVRAWQDFVQKWEIEINEWSGKLTESEQFSAIMGQATKLNLVAQKAWADQMESMLQALNLPSKVQIESLAERLDRIEDNIERMRLAMEQSGEPEAAGAQPEPRRTRKPPRKAG